MLIWLLACLSTPGADDSAVSSPSIDSLSWGCDRAADEWTGQLRTQGWIAGSTLWIYGEGQALESHRWSSLRADRGGAWEELTLTLEIVADPRQQQDGSSTAYLCGELEQLSFRLEIQDPVSQDRAQCVSWGKPLSWESAAELDSCESTRLAR